MSTEDKKNQIEAFRFGDDKRPDWFNKAVEQSRVYLFSDGGAFLEEYKQKVEKGGYIALSESGKPCAFHTNLQTTHTPVEGTEFTWRPKTEQELHNDGVKYLEKIRGEQNNDTASSPAPS